MPLPPLQRIQRNAGDGVPYLLLVTCYLLLKLPTGCPVLFLHLFPPKGGAFYAENHIIRHSSRALRRVGRGAERSADARRRDRGKPQADLVALPGGQVVLGTPPGTDWSGTDEAQTRAQVKAFSLGAHEVSQELYEALMGSNPSHFRGAQLPVECVSWLQAVEFCNRLSAAAKLRPAYEIADGEVRWDLSAPGYRLPAEAEWEYACRAGSENLYNTGSGISDAQANYCAHYPYNIEPHYFDPSALEIKPGVYRSKTVPVGEFAPNAWGLRQMHGNVAEWVWDGYNPKGTAAGPGDDESSNGERHFKVYRGGAWNDFAKHLRCAYRGILPPTQARMTIGLRLARGALGSGVRVTRIDAPAKAQGRRLVVFFSWSGNTRRMAEIIGARTGAEVVELKVEPPYSESYDEVLVQAWQAQLRRDLPKLKNAPDLRAYNTIFIGYPLWWASIPRPIASVLAGQDVTGKTILPFSSGGGGHLQQSLSDLMKLARGADFGTALEVSYSGGRHLDERIDAWLKENGILP